MSIFDKLVTSSEATSGGDNLGGYTPLASNIYHAKVKAAYVTFSRNGAQAVNLILDIDGREYNEALWISSKTGQTYYVTKEGKKINLPGFEMVDDLCLITQGKNLTEMETESRVFEVYDYEAKGKVHKELPAIVDLMGAEVDVGIILETVDKNVKNDEGKYVPSGETREQNAISKFFHPESHKTVNEARANVESTFYDKWLAKNKDQVINHARGLQGASQQAQAGLPKKTETKPLF